MVVHKYNNAILNLPWQRHGRNHSRLTCDQISVCKVEFSFLAAEIRREVRRLQQYRQEKEERAKEKKSIGVASTKKPRRASMYVRRLSEQN